MDINTQEWFIKKGLISFDITKDDYCVCKQPIIFTADVLGEKKVVLRQIDRGNNKEFEFPLTVPLQFIHDEMAADPKAADICFVGTEKELSQTDMTKDFHFKHCFKNTADDSESCVVVGVVSYLKFKFGIINIGDSELGLVIPKTFYNRR